MTQKSASPSQFTISKLVFTFFCCFVAESVKKVRNLSFYLEFIRKVRIFAVILQLEVAFLQSRFVWVLIYIGWNVLFQPFFLRKKSSDGLLLILSFLLCIHGDMHIKVP